MRIETRKLKKIVENQILLEAIDEQMLDKINSSLEKLEQIAKKYNLIELQNGIKQASALIAKTSNTFGSFRGALASKLKTGQLKNQLTGISAVSSLEAGLAVGFRQLPKIINLLQKGQLQSAEEESVENLPNAEQIRKMFYSSFKPPGLFAVFSRLPFVNDHKLVDDLMGLSIEQIQMLADDAANLGLTNISLAEQDAEEIVKLTDTQDGASSNDELPAKGKLYKKTLIRFIKTNTSIEDEEIIALINFLQRKGIKIV